MSARLERRVEDLDAGERVDAFVSTHAQLSRARARRLVEDGAVTVDGHAVKPKARLSAGALVVIDVPEASESELVPEDLPLDILHEDERVVVINKRAGMAVHPSTGHPSGTLVNALKFRYPNVSVGGELRPGLVHRLDMDTTGVIVVALDTEAHEFLSQQFRERSVDKRYLAYVVGVPRGLPRTLVTGHARDRKERRRFTTKLDPPDEHSRPSVRRAESDISMRHHAHGMSALEVTLKTGRTHQIRAHLTDIGHPLIGDVLYGGDKALNGIRQSPVKLTALKVARQALHAWRLSFVHPDGKALAFEAPLAEDLVALDTHLKEEAS